MKRCILLILLVLWAVPVGAEDVYVDNNVTDTNVASSTPDDTTYNPLTFVTGFAPGGVSVYKTLADINAATWMNPGDNVYLRAGQEWREMLIVPASGTAGNYITFNKFGSGDDPIIRYNGNFMLYGSMEEYVSATDFEGWTESGTDVDDLIEVDTVAPYYGLSCAKLTRVDNTPQLRTTSNVTGWTAGDKYTLSAYVKKGTATSTGKVMVYDQANALYLQDDGSWDAAANALEAFTAESTDWTEKHAHFTAQTGINGLRIDITNTVNNSVYHVDSMLLFRDETAAGRTNELVETPVTWNKNIYIDSKNYVHVKNLNIIGAEAENAGLGLQKNNIHIGGTSDNVIMEDVETSYAGYHSDAGTCRGIHSDSTTTNVHFIGIHSHHNPTTGIYNNAQGGSVVNCRSHDNGADAKDTAKDQGGIGCNGCSNMTISDNEVYSNGQANDLADFEISVFLPSGYIDILRNYLHHCDQGGIQVNRGTATITIESNIIDGFGTNIGATVTLGHFAGIRIGSGSDGGTYLASINNNLLSGGGAGNVADSDDVYSLVFGVIAADDVTNSSARNNIFYNNSAPDIYVHAAATITGLSSDNDLYYRPDYTGNFIWDGTTYNSLADFQAGKSMEASGLATDPLFIDDGLLSGNTDFRLQRASPARHRGKSGVATTDFRGRTRSSEPDIGAYESLLLPLPRGGRVNSRMRTPEQYLP